MPTHTPPPAVLTEADLVELQHLLPPTALALVRCAGHGAAARLLATWPGVLYPCPKFPNANADGARRWAQLSEVVGEEAMPGLAAEFGGSFIDVPTCRSALVEKRNRWIRARFDALVDAVHGPGLSAIQAQREIAIALAQAGQALVSRELERVVNRADQAAAADQPPLF